MLPAIMLGALFLTGAEFIELSSPTGQTIEINLREIVAIRALKHLEHFAPGSHCIVYTADGKNFTVAETCDRIDELIKAKLAR